MIKLADLQTGYFAHPDQPEAPFPFVHAMKPVLVGREIELQPLCDTAIPDGHEYQWCSKHIEFTYVDCQPCRNKLDLIAMAEGRGQLALFRHPSHV
jgi:hypothetical protein